MAIDVLMPVIGAEGDEAVVTAWLVDEGARVKPGQLIAEVQAEKVSMDVEAPAAGVVRGLVPINQPVTQGSPVCRIEEASGDASAPPPVSSETSHPTEPSRPQSSIPLAASPAARRLARELGLSLEEVQGSGPGGRITEADVRTSAHDSTAEVGPTGPGGEGEAMAALRSVIARNMRQSHSTTAPVTITTTADITGRVPDQITAWVVRAVARALQSHPYMNGTRDGDTFRPAQVTGIAVAIQTDQGLVAPVIRDPGSRGLREVAQEIASLAERARARQLTGADYEGGTFSVTNLGTYGVDGFTPIINLPQVAILGVGAIRTVAGFIDDRVMPLRKVTLSLTFDHAFVDGAPAAAFLAEVRRQLSGDE